MAKEVEEKTISVSLNKAREWYSKGGELRKIALSVYDEEVLKDLTYTRILNELYDDNEKARMSITCPSAMTGAVMMCKTKKQLKSFASQCKLLNVATFLNEGWEPDWSDMGQNKFYLRLVGLGIHRRIDIAFCKNENIGAIYFRSPEACEMAWNLLGDDCIIEALRG